MPLEPHKQLGPYEILAPLGAGGMGEVYRGRDVRLDRTVAIKVLAPHFAVSPTARERFLREARAISGVSHPNICTLYDVGLHEGTDYLVMEFLEGETLAERLKRGPLPLQTVLRYAVEIADAMDKAHQLGVIHRDLKPGNIMLTESGSKLLDFGLAKLKPNTAVITDKTSDLTLTENGTILGTIQYMSPEQLEGKETDARTDIFAFGSVIYEMVTGRKAFQASSHASLIGAILHVDPSSMSSLQPLVPPLLEHIARKCLHKNPADRWQTARDLAGELRWISQSMTSSISALPAASGFARARSKAWPFLAIGLPLAVAALSIGIYRRTPPDVFPAIRFAIAAPADTVMSPAPADLTVSPDGQYVLFGALSPDGNQLLWLRPMSSMSARPISGSENAFSPFWSPDSRQIAFFSRGKLKRVGLSGGDPDTICDVPDGRGGTWNKDGVIVFARNLGGPLYRVSALGGTPVAVTSLDPAFHETAHIWPEFLPDGQHFLYLAWNPERTGQQIRAGSLNQGSPKTVLDNNSNTSFVSGYLIYASKGRLHAQPFNPAGLETSGESFPIAENVWTNPATGRAAFAASPSGVIAYRNGANFSTTQFVVRDRTGRELSRISAPGGYGNPFLSPDGKRIAADLRDYQKEIRNIWTLELDSGIASRLSFGASNDLSPIWLPDGKHILYLSDTDAPRDTFNILETEFGGSAKAEVLFKPANIRELLDQAGQTVLFSAVDAKTRSDIWTARLSGEFKPEIFLRGDFNEIHARLSADGHWIAYSSDESGRYEVYVQMFPSGGGKRQVSNGGGMQPQWNPNGKELFYLAPDRTLMAATTNLTTAFEVDTPKPLFQSGVYGPSVVRSRNNYVVVGNGQSFIINSVVDSKQPINIIVGWTGR